LDLEVLREALSRPLGQEWEDASLIVQLIVEGSKPALVAAERGVSPPPQVHPGDMGRPRRGRHRRARHRHNGKRMSDGEARLRDELAMLEAQADLARADLPKAGEIERICEWLRAAGGTDEPIERRSPLEAFDRCVVRATCLLGQANHRAQRLTTLHASEGILDIA
jgi:hypothetical protein